MSNLQHHPKKLQGHQMCFTNNWSLLFSFVREITILHKTKQRFIDKLNKATFLNWLSSNFLGLIFRNLAEKNLKLYKKKEAFGLSVFTFLLLSKIFWLLFSLEITLFGLMSAMFVLLFFQFLFWNGHHIPELKRTAVKCNTQS